jgi:hypothetical protein
VGPATYDGDDLVSYALEELQNGAAGSAKIRREPGNTTKGTVLFEYNKALAAGSKPKTSTEALRNETLTRDMVATFLLVHWGELSRGERVKWRYVVVPRRDTVSFTFAEESETTAQG